MNVELEKLLSKIDEPVPFYDRMDQYYHARQPLAFMAPEAREALGDRFGRMATNIPRLAITSIAERLRVTGFRTNVDDSATWTDWKRNDLDQLAGVVHREALTLGRCFAIVWADRKGRPQVSVESARSMAVRRDPETREVVAAVKRWETESSTEAALYLPDRIVRYSANTVGAVTGFRSVESIVNPLGVVPVVEFTNGDRHTGEGVSEISDLIPLVDGLNKTLVDMMVSSEFAGRPRRWATGIEIERDEDGNHINPIPEGPRTMLSEIPEAKFGQLPGADLGSYESSVNIFLSQIMAVSALPAHYIGITTSNPVSADALRASEASLTARAEARQAQFGRSWEWIARLMLAVRTGRNVEDIEADVQWADAATRSTAQEADAVVKLVQAGILPVSVALERLGYDSDEIVRIREARRSEAFENAAAGLTA